MSAPTEEVIRYQKDYVPNEIEKTDTSLIDEQRRITKLYCERNSSSSNDVVRRSVELLNKILVKQNDELTPEDLNKLYKLRSVNASKVETKTTPRAAGENKADQKDFMDNVVNQALDKFVARKAVLREKMKNFKVKKGFGELKKDRIYNKIIVDIKNKKGCSEDEAYIWGVLIATQLSIAGFKNAELGKRPVMDTLVNGEYLHNLVPERFFSIDVKADMEAVTPKRLCEVFAHDIRDYLIDTPEESGNRTASNLPRQLRFIGSKFAVRTINEAAIYCKYCRPFDSVDRATAFFKARFKDNLPILTQNEEGKLFSEMNA